MREPTEGVDPTTDGAPVDADSPAERVPTDGDPANRCPSAEGAPMDADPLADRDLTEDKGEVVTGVRGGGEQSLSSSPSAGVSDWGGVEDDCTI